MEEYWVETPALAVRFGPPLPIYREDGVKVARNSYKVEVMVQVQSALPILGWTLGTDLPVA